MGSRCGTGTPVRDIPVLMVAGPQDQSCYFSPRGIAIFREMVSCSKGWDSRTQPPSLPTTSISPSWSALKKMVNKNVCIFCSGYLPHGIVIKECIRGLPLMGPTRPRRKPNLFSPFDFWFIDWRELGSLLLELTVRKIERVELAFYKLNFNFLLAISFFKV